MLRKVNTASFLGVEGKLVTAEVSISKGMPGLRMVGLASQAVKESGLRIRAAMSALGFPFPNSRITINLAPASMRKEGSHFDLPCAIGLIWAKEKLAQEDLDDWLIFGELSLDGKVSAVAGLLPMLFTGFEAGYRKIIIPEANEAEACAIKGAEIYKVSNIVEAFQLLSAAIPGRLVEAQDFEGGAEGLEGHGQGLGQGLCQGQGQAQGQGQGLGQGQALDFADVRGQEACKRGLAIAAAGGHGVIMLGSPGIGKSMLARRMPTIMPKMDDGERLEISAIHSVAGLLKDGEGLVRDRPFREPQPTITAVGMMGGGARPRPGELSLAHGGILFMDEVASFPRHTLELMRVPLEEGRVRIVRNSATVEYPARPLVIMATNPCACGWFGDDKHRCTCRKSQISAFWAKLSGPLLDRIDLHLTLQPPSYGEISSAQGQLDSAIMRSWVDRARSAQARRFGGDKGFLNADMTEAQLEEFCPLDDQGRSFLKSNYKDAGMTARSYFKLLKLARTIADMEGAADIGMAHLLEAYQYNRLDKWKEDCLGI